MAHMLIAERDEAVAVALSDGLQDEGFSVVVARDGQETLELANTVDLGLMVLDVDLADMSGFEVCRRIRETGNQVPIIMLAERAKEFDLIQGLRLGADDFVSRPFSMLEMMARVEAVLRRVERLRPSAGAIRVGELTIDFERLEARLSNRPLDLTSREFEVLAYLVRRKGRTVGRDQLLKDVWKTKAILDTRTVDVHVAKLRKKIERGPGQPRYILTNRGLGYQFLG